MAGINISFVNIHGIRRKKELLRHHCTTNNIHIQAIAETMTKARNTINISPYTTQRKDRNVAPGNPGRGGVALLSLPSLSLHPHDLPINLQHLECILNCINTPQGDLYICVLYSPPTNSLPTQLFDYLCTLPKFILLADLNARHKSFNDSTSNINGDILADLLISHNIARLWTTEPSFISHNGSSYPDHIIVSDNITRHCGQVSISDSVGSDHVPLTFAFNLIPPPLPIPTLKIIKNYNEADWTVFKNEIELNIGEETKFNTIIDIDQEALNLQNIIKKAEQKAVPLKTIDFSRPPLPAFIIKIIKEKRKIQRQYNKTHDPALKKKNVI
jgi:hypothetical protein